MASVNSGIPTAADLAAVRGKVGKRRKSVTATTDSSKPVTSNYYSR